MLAKGAISSKMIAFIEQLRGKLDGANKELTKHLGLIIRIPLISPSLKPKNQTSYLAPSAKTVDFKDISVDKILDGTVLPLVTVLPQQIASGLGKFITAIQSPAALQEKTAATAQANSVRGGEGRR